jgi:hypothetical protein
LANTRKFPISYVEIGRRKLLHNIPEIGDASHLPAGHGLRDVQHLRHDEEEAEHRRFPFEDIELIPSRAVNPLRMAG